MRTCPSSACASPTPPSCIPPGLRQVARDCAQKLGLTLREGVYFYCYGPQYETPAEIRAARILGGDAVGMSTAPEVIVAGHCGMEVLGFTLLSNMAAGILDQPPQRGGGPHRRGARPGGFLRPGAGLPAGDVTEFLICKE